MSADGWAGSDLRAGSVIEKGRTMIPHFIEQLVGAFQGFLGMLLIP
ncbi:hypothetical protein [Nocardia arizonensis]|nr:hypothetical protein [Nocardia arizonensis]